MFVYVHIVWFGAWILLNTGRFGVKTFDPFPYGLLTMVVSLEAIFLSTFVLISQNRLSEEAENRADLSLQIGLLTEHEVTRVLQMLDAIQDKLGIENDADSDLADLEMETKPEDVLAGIARLQQLALRRKKPTSQPNRDGYLLEPPSAKLDVAVWRAVSQKRVWDKQPISFAVYPALTSTVLAICSSFSEFAVLTR